MAKDREGSVNIYGAMQAKTAQGIVAYTDGIAHENEDGTVINLDEMLKNGVGGGSAIVDVEKLVKGGWNGTTVPNSGTVENIYFNTELSDDEVTNILKTIVSPTNKAYDILYSQDKSIEIGIANGSIIGLSESLYVILNLSEMKTFFASEDFNSSYISGSKGWNLNNFSNPVNINKEVMNFAYENNIGDKNDSLSSLVSTTPFVYSEEPKDDVFYRLNISSESGWSSTVVPNSGTVEKVYFNTNLTNDEVINLLSKLNYGSSGVNVLISNSDYSNQIKILLMNGMYAITNRTSSEIYYVSSEEAGAGFVGWNTTYFADKNYVEFNDTAISSEQYNIALENDKLSDLVSITEFKYIEGKTLRKIYSYKNGEYKLVLQEGNFEQQEGIEYIEITTDSTENIAITQEQYNFIKDNDNVVVKLILDDGSGVVAESLLYKSNFYGSSTGGGVVLYNFSSLESLGMATKQLITLVILSDLTTTYSTIDVGNPYKINGFSIANNLLTITVKTDTGSSDTYSVNIDTSPTSSSKNLISSEAVYTALQSYPKTSEVNQMIADYITTNFENGDEGSY